MREGPPPTSGSVPSFYAGEARKYLYSLTATLAIDTSVTLEPPATAANPAVVTAKYCRLNTRRSNCGRKITRWCNTNRLFRH